MIDPFYLLPLPKFPSFRTTVLTGAATRRQTASLKLEGEDDNTVHEGCQGEAKGVQGRTWRLVQDKVGGVLRMAARGRCRRCPWSRPYDTQRGPSRRRRSTRLYGLQRQWSKAVCLLMKAHSESERNGAMPRNKSLSHTKQDLNWVVVLPRPHITRVAGGGQPIRLKKNLLKTH